MNDNLWNEWRDIITEEFECRMAAVGTKENLFPKKQKGITALLLLANGLEVTAGEVLPFAIKSIENKDIDAGNRDKPSSFDEEQLDAIAFIGHRLGSLEGSASLEKYLQEVYQEIKPKGQMLFTSIDNRRMDNPGNLSNRNQNIKPAGYPGGMEIQFQFGEFLGPFFGIFTLDADALVNQAARAQWQCVIIHQEGKNDFVAWLKQEE